MSPRDLIKAFHFLLIAALMLPSAVVSAQTMTLDFPSWSPTEVEVLRSLWIGSLPPLPLDPTNKYGDDPRAVALGHRMFFDTRFSRDGDVSCATCHIPDRAFTDGVKLGRGVGETRRNTMTILGIAYSPWLFWDGRKDSLWSQALGPTESAVEHGTTRSDIAHIIADDADYRSAYAAIFGAMPDISDRARFPSKAGPVDNKRARTAWKRMTAVDQEIVNRIFVNFGKSIAAYQRRILPGPSRFDRYVAEILADNPAAARTHLTAEEAQGVALFIGPGRCTRCHNGPLLTNNDFHNTGVPRQSGTPVDLGRASGIGQAVQDPFNCLGRYSDSSGDACAELRFAKIDGAELRGAMKTPTLRSISKTAPYMHAGQYDDLRAVLDHYQHGHAHASSISELEPLHMSRGELESLRKFLLTLDGPPSTEARYLAPPR